MLISKRGGEGEGGGGGIVADFDQQSRTSRVRVRRRSLGIRAQGGREAGQADAERGGEVGRLRRSRGGGRGGGSSVCSWVRLCCVECQLIMSLLLTPYVEFFMLSLTSLLNTDRF